MRIRHKGPWALLALLALLGLPTLALAARDVSVHVGENTSVKLPPGFTTLAIGSPAIADFMVTSRTPEGGEALINGKAPGETNLIVYLPDGQKEEFNVKVLVRDLGGYMRQLQAQIGKAEGVRLRVAGDKVMIEGEALLQNDIERITKLVGKSPQVMNLVTLSPVALRILAEKIQQSIKDNGVKVAAVGQKIALRGLVFSEERKKQLEQEAKLYYPHVENLLEVQAAKLRPGEGEMIQVTGHFMEVNNAVIDGWGVSWLPGSTSQATGQQGLGGGGFTGALVGTITNLFPKFSNAKEAGGARVLESSSVSVRSGESANLESGGEIGVPVTQPSGGTTIEWKKHGVFLNVLPISQGDQVSMQISVEVSVPSDTAPGGFINFKRSKISTVQVCKSGDSIVLGGLLSQRDTKVFDKLPEGSGALFQLYSSEDFRRQRSRFVIFVTPLVLADGAKSAHQELKGTVNESFDAYQERKR